MKSVNFLSGILSKAELKQVIEYEKKIYLPGDNKARLQQYFFCTERYEIWKCLYLYRKRTYYYCLNQKLYQERKLISHYLCAIKVWFLTRKMNQQCIKTGIVFGNRNIGAGLNIWHSGVVLNGNIGKDCTFHGQNIVGMKGYGRGDEFPDIGDGVDVGVGAHIIGKVKIADKCVVGAGAVVTKDFVEVGSVIVGVSGKLLKLI